MTLLAKNHLTVVPLSSGSKGNATWIGTDTHGVLIDCGLSSLRLLERLEASGLGGAPIDAVLITHEHSDHVGGARVLSKRLRQATGSDVPFYMTRGTAAGLNDRTRPARVEQLQAGRGLKIGNLEIEPTAICHDTREPVAYTVASGGVRAGVITDLGRTTRAVERMLESLDIAVLEFNHDLEMLLDGEYPWRLKERIRGNFGHLSNAQAASLLKRAAPQRLTHLFLAHLSHENNSPDRAMSRAAEALHAARLTNVSVAVSRQDAHSLPARSAFPRPAPIEFTTRPAATKPREVAAAPAQVSLFG